MITKVNTEMIKQTFGDVESFQKLLESEYTIPLTTGYKILLELEKNGWSIDGAIWKRFRKQLTNIVLCDDYIEDKFSYRPYINKNNEKQITLSKVKTQFGKEMKFTSISEVLYFIYAGKIYGYTIFFLKDFRTKKAIEKSNVEAYVLYVVAGGDKKISLLALAKGKNHFKDYYTYCVKK